MHIPFFQPTCELSDTDKSAAEEELKAAWSAASCSVGELIALGKDFTQRRCRNASRWCQHQCQEWGIGRTEAMEQSWPFLS